MHARHPPSAHPSSLEQAMCGPRPCSSHVLFEDNCTQRAIPHDHLATALCLFTPSPLALLPDESSSSNSQHQNGNHTPGMSSGIAGVNLRCCSPVCTRGRRSERSSRTKLYSDTKSFLVPPHEVAHAIPLFSPLSTQLALRISDT